MARIAIGCLVLSLAGLVGCGSPAPDNSPLTEEQKQKIKQEDQTVEDQERSGSGTAVQKAKRPR